eukprot:COSAG02_NODE_4959_length_4781_cov_2.142674_3_plen_337_part_00
MGKGGHGFWEHLPQSWLAVINHKFNWFSDLLMIQQYADSDDHKSLAGVSALFLVLNPYLMSWLCTVMLVPDVAETSSEVFFKCSAAIGVFHVIAWIAILIAFAFVGYDPPADDDDCLFAWQKSVVIYSEADWQQGDTKFWPTWTCPIFVLVVLSPGWLTVWYRMAISWWDGDAESCCMFVCNLPITFVCTIFAMLSPSYMQKLCGANPEKHSDEMSATDTDDALGQAKCAWHCCNMCLVPNITNGTRARNRLGTVYVGKLTAGTALKCFVGLSVIHNVPQFAINGYYTSQSDEDMTLLSKLSMATSFLSFAITAGINFVKSDDQDEAIGARRSKLL